VLWLMVKMCEAVWNDLCPFLNEAYDCCSVMWISLFGDEGKLPRSPKKLYGEFTEISGRFDVS